MALLDGTMGALLLAVIVCAMFYGISCSQCYYYYTRYPRDPMNLKLLVLVVFLTDTVHQTLITHSVYWYLVTTYGDPTALFHLTTTIVVEIFIQSLTGFLVQGFYAARVYKLSEGNLFLVVPVVLLVVGEFVCGTVYSVKALGFQTFGDLAKVKSLSMAINTLAAAGDVLIAAILCTILQKSKTGFERSNLLINKLIIFSVNTGLLTSVCACLSFITFIALPNTFVYIFFFFLIARLYSNSLMATLNSRGSLSRTGTSAGETSISLRDINPVHSAHRRGDIAIKIETTKDMGRDHDTDSTKYGSADNLKPGHCVDAV